MKISVVFILVGILIIIGLILSLIGSQAITEGLVSQDGNLSSGETLEINGELDPMKNEFGVFVVQVMNFNENSIYASILDPSGNLIIEKLVDKDSIEERFVIKSQGKYVLRIENNGNEATLITGVIGHVPDSSIFSIGITGFYVLIVGMIGMVLVTVYSIKNRQESSS